MNITMRNLLVVGLFVALAAVCSIEALEYSNQILDLKSSKLPEGYYNVIDFGAKGDGVTDDTAAFQKAMNTASEEGGGRLSAVKVC